MDGYYKQKKYDFGYHEEFNLFKDSLNDYLQQHTKITGIEIGVLNGEKSKFLLSIHENIFLYGIDPIIPDSMEASLIGDIDSINRNTSQYKERFIFIQDYSFNTINLFKNESIDFIFIDGSHHYIDVKKDYELYFEKIKSAGLIYFHDSRMNRGGPNFHIGSSKFVDELIAEDKRISLVGEAFSLTCFKKT